MTEQFSVMDMAHKVEKVAQEMGLNPVINHVDNPRVEEEEHYFNAVMTELKDLGLDPHYLTDEVTKNLLELAMENKDRAHQEVIMNSPSWK